MHLKRSHILVAALLVIPACTLPGTTRSRQQRHRDEYVNQAKAQLKDLDRQISDLKAQADRAQGNAKAALNADIVQLRKKEAAAQQRVAQIEAASEQSWQSLQAGTDAALNDLKNACDQAAARFNRGP